MRKVIYLNNDWKFKSEFDESMISSDFRDTGFQNIRIPHTVAETSFNYFDDAVYQMVSCYRKTFRADHNWKDKRVAIHFEGAAHEATVYFNGVLLGTHSCGYTAFEFDISEHIRYDEPNTIVVKLDSRESLNVPPFGFVVDYMTYGGIYRDVFIEITDKTYISRAFVYTEVPEVMNVSLKEKDVTPRSVGAFLRARFRIKGSLTGCVVTESLKRISGELPKDANDEYAEETELNRIAAKNKMTFDYHTLPVVLWDVKNPALYKFIIRIYRDEQLVDEKNITFGFRNASFKADGFYLNGRKFKLRGLNRHQSYPYVGYAMPASMQIEDARIIKEDLCLNCVRTSHYPQSQDFMEACDRMGILVFTEIPGWQHIGDEDWKKQALENEREMIFQYRNHPSIFIWGVRINESADDDDFYLKTNHIAHELDSSRATGGVRADTKMHLLEDVYTLNDFSHNGKKPGCIKKRQATPDMSSAYMVTEYNGHMYPTKAFDPEDTRVEHAMRHIRVMDAIAGERDIAGGIGWCMFDYNTHKDFGSGDRICYHGVMDMFRNPKLAAYGYAMQGDDKTVLELSSAMDIGEHPECIRGDIWLFTNADSVKMYKNDVFIKEYYPGASPYRNIEHGPILVDDFIGDELAENEKFSKYFAGKVKHALNQAARHGMGSLSLGDKITGLEMMLFHRMSVKNIVDMYQKYIGDWGGEATSFKFEAIKNGEVAATIVKETVKGISIETVVSNTELMEGRSYDVASVRIRVVDQNGNVLPFFAEPCKLKTEGAIEIIGPRTVPLRGGMAGTYIKSKRCQGSKGKLIISLRASGEKIKKEISFTISERINGNV
ncbi:glycoside hydrolase family 2 TIM barrel-domain containing protein [Butyrivibrio sp. INlla16]|uniref:glycoside hydrolase family 2 protein n=1 Tax=Butyrivibrio sp. INlla16 TaxID=1520807 RepID=UPI00088B422F|nr:glycoside hydrolase family 2 TIM barrel-domain containing protein [Butyrivibrio sp. INlla16]SDB55372.1 beta-galactosidase [Butyrivibrio sp. INlla16]